MASGMYNRGAYLFVTGTNWTSASFVVMLVTASYVPDKDQNTVSQITGELSGGGYARVALAGETATQDNAGNRAVIDGNNTVFPSLQAAAGTPQYAIIYYDTGGSDATRQLIAFVDLGTPDVPNGGDYTIAWNATGIATSNT